MPVKVLLTAFGAFPGAQSNPTVALARLVDRRWRRTLERADIDLHVAVLPVVYDGAEARTRALIEAIRPDVVLHLGLAGRRKTLSLETRARNRLNTIRPDAARRLSGRLTLAAGGPDHRRARTPTATMRAAMNAAGAPCAASIDAGDYLCNQTLYASLASAAPVVGFLHIPRPANPRKPLREAGPRRGRIPLAAMARATVAGIRASARELRRQTLVKTPRRY